MFRHILILATVAAGAMFLPSRAVAQAVQLPTFQYTHANTTVSVPDRGSTYLGGVNRAASGSSLNGTPVFPLRNRSYGGTTSATGMSVGVYVHDFEALEAAAVSAAPRGVYGRPGVSNDRNLMRVQDNLLLRQRETASASRDAAPPDYSLGARANRALVTRREAETNADLDIAVPEGRRADRPQKQPANSRKMQK